MECRVGWPPGETREQIVDQISETVHRAAQMSPWLKQHPPEIEWFGWNASPHELDPQHPFVGLVSNVVQKITDNRPVYSDGSAGLDTRHFVQNGIPAVVVGPTQERIHSYDECVDIESVIKTAEIIASVIIEWCS